MENINQTPPAKRLLQSELIVINIGLDTFLDGLKARDIRFVHVDWRPPAKGNTALIEALYKLSSVKKS